MKLWKWDRFAISLIVCAVASLAIVALFLRMRYETWPIILLLTLFLAAGFTFVRGLLSLLDEQKKDTDYLRMRIRELEKKIENK